MHINSSLVPGRLTVESFAQLLFPLFHFSISVSIFCLMLIGFALITLDMFRVNYFKFFWEEDGA